MDYFFTETRFEFSGGSSRSLGTLKWQINYLSDATGGCANVLPNRSQVVSWIAPMQKAISQTCHTHFKEKWFSLSLFQPATFTHCDYLLLIRALVYFWLWSDRDLMPVCDPCIADWVTRAQRTRHWTHPKNPIKLIFIRWIILKYFKTYRFLWSV
jgi:hypothetical protein